MVSIPIIPKLKETLIDKDADFDPAPRVQLRLQQHEGAFESKDNKGFNATKNCGFHFRKLENSSEPPFRRAFDQSFLESSELRLKTRKTIILTHNATDESGKSVSTRDSSQASPKSKNMGLDLRKIGLSEDALVSYPDLEHNNKFYKFYDWKLVSKLVPVASLPELPVGIFLHSEEEYFLYFQRPKQFEMNKPPAEKLNQLDIEERSTSDTKKEEVSSIKTEEQELESKGQDFKDISKLLEDVKHNFVHRKINDITDSLTVVPSQEVLDSLRKLVDDRARNHMREKDVKVSYSCVKSNFTKNLPKKIGDQFADYLKGNSHIDMSKALKDKMSWKVLNSYLDGQNNNSNNTIGAKALIQLFINFMTRYDMSKIDESRTKDDVSKMCYKLAIMNLKVAFEELNRKVDIRKIETLAIVKSWPLLDIHYKTNTQKD